MDDWLLTFPSYGFILATRTDKTPQVLKKFRNSDLQCEIIGRVHEDQTVYFTSANGTREVFWDLKNKSYIGLNKPDSKQVING